MMNTRVGQLLSWGCLSAVAALCLVCRPVSAQEMQYPVSLAVDPDGTIFVADQKLPGIWKIHDGQLEKYFEGSGNYRTPLNAVRCVAIDSEGRLLAGDSGTREVYRFNEEGAPTPLTGGKIGMPMAIAVRPDGQLLVSDLEMHCVWQVPAEGGEPTKLADIQAPVGICLDQDDQLWVVSRRATALLRVASDGTVNEVLEQRPFEFPNQVAVDQQGNLLITDGYARAVWRVGSDRKPQKIVAGTPLSSPNGIVAWEDGFLVVDPQAQAIFQLRSDGQLAKLFPK